MPTRPRPALCRAPAARSHVLHLVLSLVSWERRCLSMTTIALSATPARPNQQDHPGTALYYCRGKCQRPGGVPDPTRPSRCHASQTKYFDTRNVLNGAGSRSIDYIYLVDLALIVPHA